MKAKILLVGILTLMAFNLVGCKEYESPTITEYGITDITNDNTNIIVTNAKAGLQGYEVIETEDGVDVILHYLKKD